LTGGYRAQTQQVKAKKETEGNSPVSKTSQDAFAMSDMITFSLPYFSLINNHKNLV